METNELQQRVLEVIARAQEVSEIWTGTLYEEVIELELSQLINAVSEDDTDRISKKIDELTKTLNKAEEAYDN